VGLQKDQPYFDNPQPQKPLAEGPTFDFLAPSVRMAEEALRISVTKLKALLEYSVKNISQAQAYLDIARDLNLMVPELYFHYDAFVREVLKTGEEKVTCARACSHCCAHYVTSVEPFELIFLHGKIRSHELYPGQLVALHRRVSLFKSLLKGGFDDNEQAVDEDKALYRYYLRGQPCPFLAEGGVCGIYENRPMSCRMYYSLSHPSLCKGKSVITPGNRNFLIELPEDIEADLARTGVLFSEFALPESLFEGLLSVNEVLGQFDSGNS
jgi:Fe-S-cluster containining protein